MANGFNARIIEEFRANAGRVGGAFQGAPMILLTTTGARSGKRHTTPLVPLIDGDDLYVFASMGGAPKHPAWYHNLVANPHVTVEQGTASFDATADVVTGPDRDAIYAKQVARLPAFGDYELKTTRTIPVIRLRRV